MNFKKTKQPLPLELVNRLCKIQKPLEVRRPLRPARQLPVARMRESLFRLAIPFGFVICD